MYYYRILGIIDNVYDSYIEWSWLKITNVYVTYKYTHNTNIFNNNFLTANKSTRRPRDRLR